MNLRPLGPEPSALARLSHTPKVVVCGFREFVPSVINNTIRCRRFVIIAEMAGASTRVCRSGAVPGLWRLGFTRRFFPGGARGCRSGRFAGRPGGGGLPPRQSESSCACRLVCTARRRASCTLLRPDRCRLASPAHDNADSQSAHGCVPSSRSIAGELLVCWASVMFCATHADYGACRRRALPRVRLNAGR